MLTSYFPGLGYEDAHFAKASGRVGLCRRCDVVNWPVLCYWFVGRVEYEVTVPMSICREATVFLDLKLFDGS